MIIAERALSWFQWIPAPDPTAVYLTSHMANASRGFFTMKAIILFLASSEVWANIIGGIVAAIVLGIISWGWRHYREWRVKQLGEFMGRMIEHRNAGLHPVSDVTAWVQIAKSLEMEAIKKASKVSVASALLINWLGEVPVIEMDGKVTDTNQRHYVDILTEVISRIRVTLERHDR